MRPCLENTETPWEAIQFNNKTYKQDKNIKDGGSTATQYHFYTEN